MRRINNGNCPQVLANNEASEVAALDNMLANGQELVFNEKLYSHKDVKEALKKSHYKKCAYCERFLNGDFGAVEHFRPKGGYQEAKGKPINKPGYYWLAYHWDNFLYACSECNTSYKGNLFPLADESKRDIANKNIGHEEPLLINPCQENPSDFIGFHAEYAVPKTIDGQPNAKGSTTIAIMGLNSRNDLLERRRQQWRLVNVLKYMLPFIGLGQIIDELTNEKAEFTGMFQNQV